MKKYTSFEITMKLVAAGCDLRKLDPEIIKLIEAAGNNLDENSDKTCRINETPVDPFSKIVEIGTKLKMQIRSDGRVSILIDRVIASAIERDTNDTKHNFKLMSMTEKRIFSDPKYHADMSMLGGIVASLR